MPFVLLMPSDARISVSGLVSTEMLPLDSGDGMKLALPRPGCR
jgi:hypothetical protein